ncbi:hypothetical protein [Halorarius litoreus]|uniref:hypothetical protein n=1 Tax=Halorarius litoreus TaxID=2962676 RepID=UPI0020CEA95F|nr:hypothetical protein [Halorarius litoreus]
MDTLHTRGSILGGALGTAVALVFVFVTHALYIEATLMGSRGLEIAVQTTIRTLTAYSSWLLVVALGGLGGLLVGYGWSKSVHGRGDATGTTIREIDQ